LTQFSSSSTPMSVAPVPAGYSTVIPYLKLKNVSNFIDWAEKALDAQRLCVVKRQDGSISHAELKIGTAVVMLSQTAEHDEQPGTLYCYVPNPDELFARAMAAHATSIMPMADMFYGDRHGGVMDPFGNTWWFAKRIENLSQEELQARATAWELKQAKEKEDKKAKSSSTTSSTDSAHVAGKHEHDDQDTNGNPKKQKTEAPANVSQSLKLFQNELGYALGYAIVCVSDMEKSVQWYQDLFGFPLRGAFGKNWTEFDTGNTALSLHLASTEKKQPEDAVPGSATTCFFVRDVEAFHKRAVQKGVRVISEPVHEPWGGSKADYADPDGLVFSIVSMPTV